MSLNGKMGTYNKPKLRKTVKQKKHSSVTAGQARIAATVPMMHD